MKKLALLVMLTASFAFAKEKDDTKKAAREPASPKLVQAYLNLAEELSISREQKLTCDTNAYQSGILELVGEATYLPGFSTSMVGPATRSQLGKILQFKELMRAFNPEDTSEANFKRALENTEFNSPGMGVLGSTSTLNLLPSGKLEVTSVGWNENDDDIKTEKIMGTWDLKVTKHKIGGTPLLRLVIVHPLKNGKTKTRVFRLDSMYQSGRKVWILHNRVKPSVDDIDYQNIKYFNEIVDECEA